MVGCAAVFFVFFFGGDFQEKDLQKFHFFFQKMLTRTSLHLDDSRIFWDLQWGFDGRSCRHFQPKVEWKNPNAVLAEPVLVVADLLRIFYVCVDIKKKQKIGGRCLIFELTKPS